MSDSEHSYADAHQPEHWRILGVRLLPFKVGHKLLLHKIKSPILGGDKLPEIQDLIVALWICSRSYAKAARSISQPLPFLWRVKATAIARRTIKDQELFLSRVLMFREYASESHKNPEGIYRDSSAEKTYAPLIGLLKLDLMERHGFTEDQVLEMPLRKAMAERAIILSERDQVFSWPEPWEKGKEA